MTSSSTNIEEADSTASNSHDVCHTSVLRSISNIQDVEIHPYGHDREQKKEGDEQSTSNFEVIALSKWNHPRINVWRSLAAFLGFFIMGANDASYGV